MVFACQVDSFQRTFVTRVVSCKPAASNGGLYEVICDDTILFPEGGGQPCDTGYMNDVKVEQVLRRGAEAVHYVRSPLDVGEEVKQIVDWERRLDHMQQHSGQHLITAIINAEYKYDTTAWWLGDKVSHIELATTKLTDEELKNIERLANLRIMEQVPVRVKVYERGDKALDGARTRGLPEDVEGPIRIVEMVGLEEDMCCGTHVSNLVQLQCVKLLYAEKGKKNKTNLFFLSGGRVMKHLTESLEREGKMTKLLKNEPAQHAELVDKLQQSVKATNKKLTAVLKELAAVAAGKFNGLVTKPKYYFHGCKEGDSDYVEAVVRGLREGGALEGDTLFVLTAGEDKSGSLVMVGKPDVVQTLGPMVAEMLGGKGAAHGPRFQAKVTKLNNLKKAEQIVEKHFAGH